MATAKKTNIIRAVGRRKAAVANVILKPGTGVRTLNGQPFSEYFHSETQDMIANYPFAVLENGDNWDVVITARGGGISGQMGVVLLGTPRPLVKADEPNKPILRQNGFLTRDARVVERKKYGRAKARKAFQFSKR